MNRQSILLPRHYILSNEPSSDTVNIAYYNAYLLANFGIEVTNPERLSKNVLKEIGDYFSLNIPNSFYNNPQDTKYFARSELLIEQLVSYFTIGIQGAGNENTNFNRIEIFKKNLPEYVQGDEIKTRKFTVVNDNEATEILKSISKSYCNYSRPFSIDEKEEFEYLFDNGYYDGSKLECKDNVFMLVDKNIEFAKFLDRKDIVKYSYQELGNCDFYIIKYLPKEDYEDYEKILSKIKEMIPYAYEVPMSKSQAKKFNKICKECGYKLKTPETNEKSPYRLAKMELDKGNVLGATEIFAKNGSLLERNLKMLISRANPEEAVEILNKLPDKNPIALYQMVNSFETDRYGEARTFKFTKNGRVKRHIETDYETEYRKSALDSKTCSWLKGKVIEKIENHYDGLEKLGKVYISPAFEKIALPTNTSATGKGLDVLPTGSRTAVRGNSIRTFVYWENNYDIDSSLAFLDKNDNIISAMNFSNYSGKEFGNACLFSGDCRASKGSEFYDIKIDELKAQGVSKVIYAINGFRDKLDLGEIYSGYQDKNNLETKAWDPKNIEFKLNIKGDSRSFACFGIDLDKKETITINQMLESNSRIISSKELKAFENILKDNYLEINMATILRNRGEIVSTPEEADIVFDEKYQPNENQVAIRPYEIEKLVDLVNDGTIEKKSDLKDEQVEASNDLSNNETEFNDSDFDDVE